MTTGTLGKTLIKRYLTMLKGKKAYLDWKCTGRGDYPRSRRILKKLGLADFQIVRVLGLASTHGGHCDCEILANAKRALLANNWARR